MEQITVTNCISCPFCGYDTADSSYFCQLIPVGVGKTAYKLKTSIIKMSETDPLCPLLKEKLEIAHKREIAIPSVHGVSDCLTCIFSFFDRAYDSYYCNKQSGAPPKGVKKLNTRMVDNFGIDKTCPLLIKPCLVKYEGTGGGK